MSRLVERDDARFCSFVDRLSCHIICGSVGTADAGARDVRMQPFLTVPLLCCPRGFEVEGLQQLQSGGTQAHSLERGPEVDHVSSDPTFRIETLEDVFAQVDVEGASGGGAVVPVDRTGPAALAAAAAQAGEETEVLEHALER